MEKRSSNYSRSSHSSSHSSSSSSSKQKESLPHMRYKLTKLTQAQTLLQIAIKTEGFYTMSTRSADWVQHDVRSREFSSFGSYPAPKDLNIIDAIIGEDNYYLKVTMKKHDIDFICHDAAKGEFQFWGEYQCCIRAMNELRYRIHKISSQMEEKNPPERYNYEWATQKPTQPQPTYWASYIPPESPSFTPESPSFSPESPSFSPESPSFSPEKGNTDISYSKVATAQMSKMGFVAGTGLGLKHTGRITPVDPICDMGGRSSHINIHHGLGFTEQEEEEDTSYMPIEGKGKWTEEDGGLKMEDGGLLYILNSDVPVVDSLSDEVKSLSLSLALAEQHVVIPQQLNL